jgi:hypothetical protein
MAISFEHLKGITLATGVAALAWASGGSRVLQSAPGVSAPQTEPQNLQPAGVDWVEPAEPFIASVDGTIQANQPEPNPVSVKAAPVSPTYLEYAIRTEAQNITRIVHLRTLELLRVYPTEAELHAYLWEVNQVIGGGNRHATNLIERQAIHLALAVVVDGEPRPIPGEFKNPTVNEYREVIGYDGH